MPITFDRNLCCDVSETISREWLVTNGRGAYAAGTVAGALTRMEHGLLVAAPASMATPHVLVAKLDEEVNFDQRTYYLGTNEYHDGTLNPSGFVHLESFRLEEGFPVFTYRIGGLDGMMLEKRIWMPYGQATTCIQYRTFHSPASANYDQVPESSFYERYFHQLPSRVMADQSLTLTLLPLTAYRPYHQPQYGNINWHFDVQPYQHSFDQLEEFRPDQHTQEAGMVGCSIKATPTARPYHLLVVGQPESQITFLPAGVWYWHFLRRHDQIAGHTAYDDLYLPGVIKAHLWPGEAATLTLIVTNEDLPSQTFTPEKITQMYERTITRQRSLHQPQRYFGEGGNIGVTGSDPLILPLIQTKDPLNEGEEYLHLLYQAGDHFIVQRPHTRNDFAKGLLQPFHEQEELTILLSGYYGMEELSREMLIALPGLLLTTGRYEQAKQLLRTFARCFKQGLLPDRLPATRRPVEDQAYTNVDVTLWYFYALDYYLRITRDYDLLNELLPRLDECIRYYKQGTLHGITVDNDGLILIQSPKLALTWMNEKQHGRPITPRTGKPVEVNALWYHALSLMDEWLQYQNSQGRITQLTFDYQDLRRQCRQSFQERFWYEEGGYLYDLVDGPDGNETAFRPNQIFAMSLRHSVLDNSAHIAILEQISTRLLTSYGLRSLAPGTEGYQGTLPQIKSELPAVLHQGSAWTWLLGAYIDALLQIKRTASTRHVADEDLHIEYLWRKGLQVLEPFQQLFQQGMLGMTEAVFSGDAPHAAGNLGTTATATGELLRIYNLLAQRGLKQINQAVAASR